jgi:hypothetical protein
MDMLGRLSVTGFYGRLPRLQCDWVCMREFSSFKVHLAGGTRFREVSSSRYRLMGLHLRGSATIL